MIRRSDPGGVRAAGSEPLTEAGPSGPGRRGGRGPGRAGSAGRPGPSSETRSDSTRPGESQAAVTECGPWQCHVSDRISKFQS
eukprot:753172-Hanusia_phi.AAC.4